jgi:hypothetical protein
MPGDAAQHGRPKTPLRASCSAVAISHSGRRQGVLGTRRERGRGRVDGTLAYEEPWCFDIGGRDAARWAGSRRRIGALRCDSGAGGRTWRCRNSGLKAGACGICSCGSLDLPEWPGCARQRPNTPLRASRSGVAISHKGPTTEHSQDEAPGGRHAQAERTERWAYDVPWGASTLRGRDAARWAGSRRHFGALGLRFRRWWRNAALLVTPA